MMAPLRLQICENWALCKAMAHVPSGCTPEHTRWIASQMASTPTAWEWIMPPPLWPPVRWRKRATIHHGSAPRFTVTVVGSKRWTED